MKRVAVLLVLILLTGGGVFAYVEVYEAPPAPRPILASATEGDVSEIVSATGTIQPTRTVEIGTQVSGVISKLYADYNSVIKKGEVVATLDPLLSQAAVDSAKAALAQTQIALVQANNEAAIDHRNATRAVDLFNQGIDTALQRDAAVLQAQQDDVTVVQDKAAVTGAQANLDQANVNLTYCTITSPVDGVVISRDVDEGQTVSARMAVPGFFDVGTDLTKLQVLAAVDEADMAKVRPGQNVSFTVESYKTPFHGIVSAIHLDATTTSNVVTYETVVLADNPDLRLRPGMTAQLSIETAKAANVVRIPNDALKFRPTAAVFDALHEPLPPPVSLASAKACAAGQTCDDHVSTTGTPGTEVEHPSGYASVNGSIDNRFAAPSHMSTVAYVWTLDHNQMDRIPVRVGITDGTWSELVSGTIRPGESLLTNMILPVTTKPSANPLMPTNGRGGFGPGGRGGRF